MVKNSRTKIQCGYKNCNYKCERRNLKRHSNAKHPGSIVIERSEIKEFIRTDGKANNVTESQSIPLTSRISQEALSPIELAHKPEDMDQTSEPHNASLLGHQETPTAQRVANFRLKIDALSDKKAAIHRSIHTKARIYIERNAEDPYSIFGGLEDSNINGLEDANINGLEDANIKENTNSNIEMEALSSCRSLEELQEENANILELVPEDDIIFCVACKKSSENSIGVFKYNFSLGTTFENQPLPKKFQVLKQDLYKHFSTATHIKNWNDTIAKRVLLTAYYVVESPSMKRKSFTDLINLSVMNGGYMGDIDHSAGLIDKFIDLFCEELLGENWKSMVESLATVLVDMFGEKHYFDDTNLAKELAIIWTGPSLHEAGSFIETIHRKLDIDFTRGCNKSNTHTVPEESYPLECIFNIQS